MYEDMRLRLAAFLLGLSLLGVSVVATVQRHSDEPVQVIDATTGRPVDDSVLLKAGVLTDPHRGGVARTSGAGSWLDSFGVRGAAIGAAGLALLLFALSSF